MSELKALYRETIRRHAGDPVGYRRLIEATHRCEGHNPMCGDRIELLVRYVDGVIEDVAFEGEACAICLASASLLCEHLPGRPGTDLGELTNTLESALQDLEGDPDAGFLSPLLGVRPYPSRIQCAMLPWDTAGKSLEKPIPVRASPARD